MSACIENESLKDKRSQEKIKLPVFCILKKPQTTKLHRLHLFYKFKDSFNLFTTIYWGLHYCSMLEPHCYDSLVICLLHGQSLKNGALSWITVVNDLPVLKGPAPEKYSLFYCISQQHVPSLSLEKDVHYSQMSQTSQYWTKITFAMDFGDIW